MDMTRSLLVALLAGAALNGCETAHDAAVASFRVLDAPHQYIRQKLDLDENDNAQGTTTSSTTTVQQSAVPPGDNVYSQPYQQTAPPPPPPSSRYTSETVTTAPPPPPRQRVITERTRVTERSTPTPSPTPAPRVTTRSNTTTEAHPLPNEQRTTTTTTAATTATSHKAAAEKGSLPYAKPVPGKPGYVFSPFDPNGGYVDVTGFAPGSKVKDPYSGKVFLVP